MSNKHVLLAVLPLVIGLFLLTAIPAQAQSVEYDCAATKAATSVPAGWQCSCPCATCRLSCSQTGSGGGSSSATKPSSSASLNTALKQQVASTLVDAFVNMLFSTDSKAAEQQRQMMEELKRRKEEAERQHKFEEHSGWTRCAIGSQRH